MFIDAALKIVLQDEARFHLLFFTLNVSAGAPRWIFRDYTLLCTRVIVTATSTHCLDSLQHTVWTHFNKLS